MPTDIGFGNAEGANNWVNTTVLQPDGKILIGGYFTSFNGTAQGRITRLNSNGSVDVGFNAIGANNIIEAIALQPDGKVLIVGIFTAYNGTARNRVARLNSDGSLDTGFDPGSGADVNISSIAVQSDGKILIGGDFTTYNGITRSRIARLNSDGSLDLGFDPGAGANQAVFKVAVQPDGKILICGRFTTYNGVWRNRVARINTDGSLDTGFNPGSGSNSNVYSIGLQPDGKIVIGGQFTAYNGTSRARIARLNSNGSLDTGFNPGSGADNIVISIVLHSNGKLLIGGQFTTYSSTSRNRIARLNSNGSLDSGFNPGAGADAPVDQIALQPDGKVLLGGNFNSYNGSIRNYVLRLTSSGDLDPGFLPAGGANGVIRSMVLQSDGKILIGGGFTSYNGVVQLRVARLNSDGTLAAGFNPASIGVSNVYALAVQPDGKILIGGDFTIVGASSRNRIARLNSDGSLDPGFDPGTGANSTVTAIALQPDGKVVIGGSFTTYNGTTRNRIARLNSDGSLDPGFDPGTGANSTVNAIAWRSDGKLVVGGSFTTFNSTARNRMIRLNSDGSVDIGFNPGTGFNSTVNSIALQTDGKVLVCGGFNSYNGTTRNRIARLNDDGVLDTGFDPGTGASSSILCMAQKPNGQILVGGAFGTYNGIGRSRIARVNANGSVDASFDPGTGANGTVYAIALQPNGQFLMAGNFTSYNGTGRNRLAHILSCECPVGATCDDNNACTANDVIGSNCQCAGTFQDADADGTCDSNDLCLAGPEPGAACNDNNACTTNDVIGSNCQCAGTFADADADGICDANDLCPAGSEPGTACNDNNACTTNDVIGSNCQCAGTFADADADGTCDANDLCPAGPEPGTACNDNNACTINDVIGSNCQCAGTIADADNDGTPDCFEGVSEDSLSYQQWNLTDVHAPQVWPNSTGGTTALGHRITVGILDSEVLTEHPDLQANIGPGTAPNSEVDDFHGTRVSGVVAAIKDNGIGISGVAPGSQLMVTSFDINIEAPLDAELFQEFLQRRSLFNSTNGAEGELVVAINMSFTLPESGSGQGPPVFEQLREAGVLLITGGTNTSVDLDGSPQVPSSLTAENKIVVSSIGPTGSTPFAYGDSTVHLLAPGLLIPTTDGNGAYTISEGNSLAIPHVAAAVSLLYGVPCPQFAQLAMDQPWEAARRVRDAIVDHTTPVAGADTLTITGGKLNVEAAYNALMAQCGQFCDSTTISFTPTNGTVTESTLYSNSDETQIATGTGDVITRCLAEGCFVATFGSNGIPAQGSFTVTDAQGTILASGNVDDQGNAHFTLGNFVLGCTNPNAGNYNPNATCDDGTCCLTNLHIALSDTGNDGWEGAEYTLATASGTVISTGTLASGLGTFVDLPCQAAGCYTFSVTSGADPSEVSWSISGGAFLNGVAGMTLPFTIGDASSGCTDPSANNYDPLATCDDGSCCNSIAAQLVVTPFDLATPGAVEYAIDHNGTQLSGTLSLFLQPDLGFVAGVLPLCSDTGCLSITLTANTVALSATAAVTFEDENNNLVFDPALPFSTFIGPTYGGLDLCDGFDNDCDGAVDEDGLYADLDGDGFGNALTLVPCGNSNGVPNADDCNDADATVNPDATELCDLLDNNCNGSVDEGFYFFLDADGDGIGRSDSLVHACSPGPGLSTVDGDCDDTNALITGPGSIQILTVDPLEEGTAFYSIATSNGTINGTITLDADQEGVGSASFCLTTGCITITITENDVDLFEEGAFIFTQDAPPVTFAIDQPFVTSAGVVELCDGLDNDCDGQVDDNCSGCPDADGDGTCDADDLCPTGPEPGTACNDNNTCTVNDFIGTNCSCAGTFADADADGTCDANDLCPAGPEPGSACNDNNACTTGDVIGSNCQCAGTFTDSDADGTCDANDLCAGPEPGTACNDNNACTTNDVIGTNCQCAGTFADADADGTCDANDLCPAGPEPGTACNDNNICTTGDVIGSNCQCAGTLADADADGTCDANDLCPAGPEPGTACNDNNACTINDVIGSNCQCAGTFADADADGTCDANDLCPAGPEPGTACNDNNVCTTGDLIGTNCQCAGTFADADADGTCDADDCDPLNPTVFQGASEICDGLDNNCDGSVDEGLGTFFADTDGDGLGDPNLPVPCSTPGAVQNNTDCDDMDPTPCGSVVIEGLVERRVIGSAGGASQIGGIHIEWTLGEPAVSMIENNGLRLTQGFHQSPAYRLRLNLRALLQGPYIDPTEWMTDGLRSGGWLPLTEPYTAAGYTHVLGGNETTHPDVLAVVGLNAIVDWIVVELRDPTMPDVVLATRSGLLQRDGDIVDVDGFSPLAFKAGAANYRVAVLHRNHLPVITAAPVLLSPVPADLDLTNVSTPLFGVEPTKVVGSVQLLWSGDVNLDGKVRYTGTTNDRDPILVRVGGTTPNNTASGYFPEDTNMDGTAKYTGTRNDRDPILVNIGGTVPTNVRNAQMP